MDAPLFLPPSLAHYCEAADDEVLFEQLRHSISDLYQFFVYAAADEFWMAKHGNFLRKAIIVLTRRYFRERLRQLHAVKVASLLRSHHNLLGSSIDADLRLEFSDQMYSINSLLFTVDSPYLRRLVFYKCNELDIKYLKFVDRAVDHDFFLDYLSYCRTGEIPNLIQYDPDKLEIWMAQAIHLQCEEVEKIVAHSYRRYLGLENVCHLLVLAYNKRWKFLAAECRLVINHLGLGFRCLPQDEGLAIELFDYRELTLYHLDLLQPLVTHFTCRGYMTTANEFGELMDHMPSLTSLHIPSSPVFSEQLMHVSEKLRELDLSQCPWVDAETLQQIITRCPRLDLLRFCDNTQMNQSCWSLLARLKSLSNLDVTGCFQIEDTDLKVLMLSCVYLTHFSLKGCFKISDRAFFDLSRFCKGIDHLSVAHCNIEDAGLVEIAFRCPLRWLDVELCMGITAKGILEVTRHALGLTYINITGCNINQTQLTRLRQMAPRLTIDHSVEEGS